MYIDLLNFDIQENKKVLKKHLFLRLYGIFMYPKWPNYFRKTMMNSILGIIDFFFQWKYEQTFKNDTRTVSTM